MKLNINGIDKEVSKETCALAVTDYFKSHPEPEKYQFQTGDVARNLNIGGDGGIRIIVESNEKLKSFGLNGWPQSTGQAEFEKYGYEKIGELKDFIKLDDLERNKVDLEGFETTSRRGIDIRLELLGSYICIWAGELHFHLDFDEATEYAQKIIQEVATARRKQNK